MGEELETGNMFMVNQETGEKTEINEYIGSNKGNVEVEIDLDMTEMVKNFWNNLRWKISNPYNRCYGPDKRLSFKRAKKIMMGNGISRNVANYLCNDIRLNYGYIPWEVVRETTYIFCVCK